jgi:hypothetical protein
MATADDLNALRDQCSDTRSTVAGVEVYPPFCGATIEELATHDLTRDILGISGV